MVFEKDELTFNTAAPDPGVTYQIFNIDNEKIYSLTIKKSQLPCAPQLKH
jgi:hypothetical protein